MEIWNYFKPTFDGYSTQDDWNQTIVTMFHSIVNENKITELPIKIISPTKFKKIFDSLNYIDDKFTVEYINNNGDIIDVGGYKLGIINYK